MRSRLLEIEAASQALPRRPRVFFEEWDEPHISCIRWVSELVGIAGGDDVLSGAVAAILGKDRIIADGAEIVRRNPDIVVGSWCGKKFRAEKVAARPGWDVVNAVRDKQLFEIKSADILQPGPAALTDGVVVLVGNEIGLGVIPLGRETRAFVDALGQLNQQVAGACERVTLMAAGLPLTLKALP
jgi:iron complex transport system substrate-binding protein